jgi:hypothetical protein
MLKILIMDRVMENHRRQAQWIGSCIARPMARLFFRGKNRIHNKIPEIGRRDEKSPVIIVAMNRVISSHCDTQEIGRLHQMPG